MIRNWTHDVTAKNAAARRKFSIKCGICAALRRSDVPSP